jgi:hypothetical protein
MVNVTNRPDVAMRLRPREFFLGHGPTSTVLVAKDAPQYGAFIPFSSVFALQQTDGCKKPALRALHHQCERLTTPKQKPDYWSG